jgi:hypothetical protein
MLAASGSRAWIESSAPARVVVNKVVVDLVGVGILHSPSSTFATTTAAAPENCSGTREALRVAPLTFPLPLRLPRLVGGGRHLLHDIQRHLCIDVGVRVDRVRSPSRQEGLLDPISS